MGLLAFMDRLIQNAEQFAKTEGEKLPSNLTEDQVFSVLQSRSEKTRALMHDSNRLIEEHLNPALEAVHEFSDEDADVYSEFAISLYTLEKHVDIGLAYPIHKALLERARERGDIDRILRHLYWQGMIQMQWPSNMYTAESIATFKEAAAYKERYASIENAQTRMLINRCVGNLYVSISGLREQCDDYTDFFRAVDEAVSFWSDPLVRARDTDFPWEAFITNSHQNICSWVDRLRSTNPNDKELALRVYNSAQTLYGKDEALTNPGAKIWPNSRTAYLYFVTRYHVGMISAREVVNGLSKMFFEVKTGDYSRDAMYRTLHLSAVIFAYLKLIPDLPHKELIAQARRIMDRVYAYCQNIPNGFDRYATNTFVSAFAPASFVGTDTMAYLDTVLRLTSFSHLPTYVHSVMVGNLMELFAKHFIDHEPELLVGMCGAETADEVVARREEIQEEMRKAGLAHDAGKIAYVNTVALCSRKINDREFTLIKKHTALGYDMFSECGDCGCIVDVIRGHHKWHDGSCGYPEDYDNTRSPYKFAIDICSVADSIDAATDSVGRSYAPGRTLGFVLDEIHEQAGTRYSPVVARALRDEELLRRIGIMLTTGRKGVYYSAYLDLESRSDVLVGSAG